MSVDLNDLRIRETSAGTRRRGRLPLLLALLLLPVGFALGWFLRGGSPGFLGTAVEVQTGTPREEGGGAAPSGPTGAFSEGGWIEVPSYHPIVVSALIPGRVDELLALEGSRVARGDVLARLYAKDLEDALRLADSEVAAAKASLDLLAAGYRKEDVEQARQEVERLGRELELAKRVESRTRALLPSGAASAEELERDETAVRVADASHAAARAELAKLEAGYRTEEVEKARAELARAEAARDLAKSRLSYAEVRSPADGVVLERFVTPGTSLAEGRLRILSLYDPDDLQARVDVRQENAGRVRVGQSVEIRTDAEPDRDYHGEVIRVEPMADLKKNTVQAKIRIRDPGPGLHPEMICRVRFLEPEAADAAAAEAEERILTIPAAAVREEGGRSFVFVVAGGAARRTEVRLGESRGDRVVVERGLTVRDRIVVSPPPGLADGDEVKEASR